jgi:hypothetical protein
MESFGNRDQCIKTTIQFSFKKFGSRVLVIGNNMLTGQNSAIAESVNKKRSNANFSQCNEA